MRWSLSLVCLALSVWICALCLEPISVVGAIGFALAGYLYRDRIGQLLGFYEGCHDDWIPQNITELRAELRQVVFGQELATNCVVTALESHYYKARGVKFKPLVLSFHGSPGTGKNFVTELIVKNMFFKGVRTQYAHFYSAHLNFPDPLQIYNYQAKIRQDIEKSISQCQRSIFIFDEVEKMSDGLLGAIEPYATGQANVQNINYGKIVFILLSNTGQLEILERSSNLSASGYRRSQYKLSHFKNLKLAAYREKGGLKGTRLVKDDLIDFYIPFLPLERSQVVMCIEAEIQRIKQIISDNLIKAVLNRVNFDGPYAVGGCKRLPAIVNNEVFIQRMKVEGLY